MLIPASPSRDAARRSSPGRMGKFDLRNIGFCVITAMPIQNGLGLGRIVYNETDGTLALLERELLYARMLTSSWARAWQSLPSVPGRSSRRIVNSFAVGILRNLLQLCVGNAVCVPRKSKKSLVLEGRKRKRPFPLYLGPVGPSGQGRIRRLLL